MKKKKLLLVGIGKEDLEEALEDIGEKEIEVERVGGTESIPRGYDAYILHISRINEEDVKKLRLDNPKSWICGLTNAVKKYDPSYEIINNLWKYLDRVYLGWETTNPVSDIEIIVEEIKKGNSKFT